MTTFTKAFSVAGGYHRFPSGLIMQWASIGSDASGVCTFNFPIAFPTAALLPQATSYVLPHSNVEQFTTQTNPPSLTQCTAKVWRAGASAVNISVNFLVFGY